MPGQPMDFEGPEPIAIVGMGCRFPGGVSDSPGLWNFLKAKRSGYKEFSAPRFSSKGFYHPNQERPGSMSTKGGFLLDEDPRLFDPGFFGMTGLELETMDASQRKLLEVVYEAFENAGETWDSVSGSSTGVFIGNFSLDHWITQARDWDYQRPYALTGACTSILGNRISYIFNLKGPSLAMDTACSSSMYAIHMAVNAIRNGDCDSAIVAAANWIMDPSVQIGLDKLGALSSTSICHTFDASADGYARGEGFSAIYLKRLSKAVLDESPIRSVIRGTAVNANGRTGGITRPSAAGQEAVIRKAYENAGNLKFSDTTYFELHGTGTPVGDPIEVSAVGSCFSTAAEADQKLFVGSVKTNLGHSEGASAMASIMKVVLSMEADMIPPSIGIETLNPAIDFDKAGVEVVRDLIAWPKDRLRRASINSFGFGGANGHCIIDHVHNVLPGYVKPGVVRNNPSSLTSGTSGRKRNWILHHPNGHTTNGTSTSTNGHNHSHPAKEEAKACEHYPIQERQQTMAKTVDARTPNLVLLPFSAHDEQSLAMNIAALSEVVASHSLADVAYTLSTGRSKLRHRSFRIIDIQKPDESFSTAQTIQQASSALNKIGFVFTGQGAQWYAMGSQLIENRAFRAAIEFSDYVLSSLPTKPNWKIVDIVTGECAENAIQKPEISQTVCTAVQMGLVDLLASWSIRPSSVVGHSSGEIAAAYASGYLTAAEAITTAWFRGNTVTKNTKDGSMLAVGMGPGKAEEYLADFDGKIQIAAINSPESTTLSGDTTAVVRLAEILKAKGEFNRLLRTGGMAYHSHHMQPLGQDYCARLTEGLDHIRKVGLSDSSQRYPRVAWVSSVHPHKTLDPEKLDASYWQMNLASPVRFSEAVSRMVEPQGVDVMLEVGPHAALKGPVGQIVRSLGKSIPYVSALERNKDARRTTLTLAGTLFALGASIDLVAVNAVDELRGKEWVLVHGCTAIDLPPYRYRYGPIVYNESRVSKEYRLRSTLRHDLLGSKVVGNAKSRPQWRNILRLKDLPWLGDHRLLPLAVMPAAGLFNMAMVAASQVHEDTQEHLEILGYMLRNTSIKTALKIPEDDFGVEVILSMELSNEATAQSLDWARFSISSVSRTNGTWDEHCSGQVKVDVAKPLDFPKLSAAMDARTTSAGTWYKHFAAIGLGYGTTFQALSDIRSDPVHSRAVAKVGLKTTAGTIAGGESSYPIHPASLDSIFQLGLISCYGGQTENAKNAFVPVHLSEMYLKSGIAVHDYGTAIAHGQVRGLRGAYAKLQLSDKSGDLMMNIDSLRCISYLDGKSSTDNESNQFRSPYTRLVWRPDVRLMSGEQCSKMHPPPQENVDNAHFFPLMNKFAGIVLVDIYETLLRKNDRPKPTGIGGHFASWVCRRVEGNGSSDIVDARKLPSQERLKRMEELCSEIDHLIEIKIVKRLHENMEAILWEQTGAVELLQADGILTALYETGMLMKSAYPHLSRLFQLLGHADPNQRILELGAGTGRATSVAMKALSSANGIKRYKDYTFTDVSAEFIAKARKNLADHYDVNFSVLDIETDPQSQGFEAEYDIVMASQTLYATMTIANTLDHCKRLLKPGGKLILVENTQNHDFVGIMLGTLTGYWQGIPDGRTEAPFLSLEGWNKALKDAGFSGTELLFKDYPDGQNTTTVIMSTLQPSDGSENRGTKRNTVVSDVQLLYSSKQASSLILQTAKELERRGVRVNLKSIEDVEGSLPSNARVIADLDDSNLLVDANNEQLERFKYIVSKSRSLFLLTSGGIAKANNPDISFIPGLLRTLANENPSTRFMSLDIDTHPESPESDDKSIVQGLMDLELSLQQRDDSGKSKDLEYVWQDGCMWVSRFVPDDGLAAYDNKLKAKVSLHSQLVPLDSQGPVRAAFETPGILSSLYFCPYTELQEPLPHDWIIVKVAAVGLNWKDLGLSSGRFDGNNLSSEYSGTISEVGTSVAGLTVGDKVYGMGKGHFGNYTRVPAAFAKKLQPQDDLVEVATMPLVYMTAVYAFEHITRLRRGQKVLIQSATGGLGLAGIQLAQSKGAEVYATVGTADKVQFLVETMKLPASHIFMSRSIGDLVAAASRLPKGGFDVILSTSRGEMLYASLRALAPLGHLIDVGRSEVRDAKMIGLELFQKSANFSSFDLSLVLDEDAEVGEELIQAVDEHYRAGRIGPIRPFTTSCISKLDQTLLNFSKGTHIGKLVVTFQPDAQVRMAPPAPRASFDPAARYIVSGGLGGLGRSILTWMCSHGAQDLILLSRHGAATDEARMLIQTLQARGVAVEAVKCDVSNLDDVLKVTRKATSSDRPVKGVLHAAVSYLDISFDKVSIDRWQQSLAAKISGTRNLHEATRDLPLDFFVMTTSTESVYALATQSAYTAANVYQEAFARYRRQLGLVASTASFGLVTDVGSVGTDSATVDLFKRNRTQTMTEREFLELLEPAFFKSGPEKAWSGMDQDPLSSANYYTGLDPAVLASINSANLGSNTSLPQWYYDARVSQIMRAYQDAGRHSNSRGGTGKHDSEDSSPAAVMAKLRNDFEEKIRASIADDDRTEVSAFTATAIAKTIAGMLYIDVEGMNTNKTVAEYGIDSLISAELRNWLRNAFAAEISTLVLLDSHTSIAQLASNIVDIGVEQLSENN